ncbi:caspase family protein [Nonomuraea bangladeshensis]|uniref:Caspase family protein n=1 Tax=Nonomuraea bangladeshensis TaxID=404385 RepID=A0ABV3HAA2_9ACTN
MSRVPDPALSRVVLIGTAHYDFLPALASVEDNLLSLADVLTAEEVWGLPADHVTIVADPVTGADLLDPVVRAADEATDTLVFYYAGHGLTDPRRGELHLALKGSDAQRPYTAVSYAHVRDALLDSRATRRIVILDCCHSGRALGTMSDPVTAAIDEAGTEGTYVLAATAENQKALAPAGEPHTAFTAELLRIFQDGIQGRGPLLDLDTIYTHVRAAMRAKGRPLPQKRDRNTAGQLTLVRNRAHATPADLERESRERARARLEEHRHRPATGMRSRLVEVHDFDPRYHTGGPRAIQGKCSWHGSSCDEKVVASVLVRIRGADVWHAVCERALRTLRTTL